MISALIDQYHRWIPPSCHYPIDLILKFIRWRRYDLVATGS